MKRVAAGAQPGIAEDIDVTSAAERMVYIQALISANEALTGKRGLSVGQIAVCFGISPSCAANVVDRAIHKLRTRYRSRSLRLLQTKTEIDGSNRANIQEIYA